MNVDAVWSLGHTKVGSNMVNLNNLITTCESFGLGPHFPYIVPLPFEDVFGLSVSFSMLQHYLRLGSHSASYKHFATIWKQRSEFINI